MAAGRPPYQPTSETRAQVMALVSFGIPQEDICKMLGISVPTLISHYEKEMATGLADANSKVAGVLFKKAYIDEDLTAVIFWLKTRAKWREKDPEDNTKAMSIIEQLIQAKK